MAGVAYLSGLGVTIIAAELEVFWGTPPPPLAAELARDLNITEQQAEILMSDYLGLSDLAPEMSGPGMLPV